MRKLISEKPKFSDFCLLLNFNNNKEENEDGSINLNNTLENISDKLIDIFDSLSTD